MNFRIQKDHLLKSFIIFFWITAIFVLNKTLRNPDVYLNNTDQYNSTKAYLEISKNASQRGPLVSGNDGEYKIYVIGPNDSAFPHTYRCFIIFWY